MPELPEVETILRGLRKHLTGEVICKADCKPARIFHFNGFNAAKLLAGDSIKRLERRCKYLVFRLSRVNMVIHLGMTGQLLVEPAAEPTASPGDTRDPHVHFTLSFQSGKKMRYRDTRKFGKILFFPGETDMLSYFQRLGTEPLSAEFTFRRFDQMLGRRKCRIKSFLLQQSGVCGIGNIYADEALYQAGIHPESLVSSLNESTRRALHRAIPEVLQKGIDSGGTTFSDYLNSEGEQGGFQEELHVYGREKLPCRQCATLIERIQVGGRSSHFCSACQKKFAS